MRRETVKLTTVHRRVLYAVMLALAATGVLWLVFHYFIHATGDFGDERHPLEAWWLKTHGAAAMLALLVLGSLGRGHVLNGWKASHSRRSGGTLVAFAAILVITGWSLYYVGDEQLRAWTSIVHWGLGVAAVAALPVHIRLARRRTRVRSVQHTRVA